MQHLAQIELPACRAEIAIGRPHDGHRFAIQDITKGIGRSPVNGILDDRRDGIVVFRRGDQQPIACQEPASEIGNSRMADGSSNIVILKAAVFPGRGLGWMRHAEQKPGRFASACG